MDLLKVIEVILKNAKPKKNAKHFLYECNILEAINEFSIYDREEMEEMVFFDNQSKIDRNEALRRNPNTKYFRFDCEDNIHPIGGDNELYDYVINRLDEIWGNDKSMHLGIISMLMNDYKHIIDLKKVDDDLKAL